MSSHYPTYLLLQGDLRRWWVRAALGPCRLLLVVHFFPYLPGHQVKPSSGSLTGTDMTEAPAESLRRLCLSACLPVLNHLICLLADSVSLSMKLWLLLPQFAARYPPSCGSAIDAQMQLARSLCSLLPPTNLPFQWSKQICQGQLAYKGMLSWPRGSPTVLELLDTWSFCNSASHFKYRTREAVRQSRLQLYRLWIALLMS